MGPCFVQAKAKCVRDSLRRLQDVPKFLDSIKTAVSSVVETIEIFCDSIIDFLLVRHVNVCQ